MSGELAEYVTPRPTNVKPFHMALLDNVFSKKQSSNLDAEAGTGQWYDASTQPPRLVI